MSENGLVDPITGWPAVNAVVFKDGRVINLGTLAGGYESQAVTIDDRGDVAGFASNGTADEFSMLGWGTQTRSFLWRDGVMRDIGTLGGAGQHGGHAQRPRAVGGILLDAECLHRDPDHAPVPIQARAHAGSWDTGRHPGHCGLDQRSRPSGG
jgi:probable HAF family extracellular repeat protein